MQLAKACWFFHWRRKSFLFLLLPSVQSREVFLCLNIPKFKRT
nr:MAG TPA: hypothetical protein [Caudoviricetes sp.]